MSLRTAHQLPRRDKDTALLPQSVPHQRSASASSFSSKTNSRATSSEKDCPDLSPNKDFSGFQEGGLGSDGDKVERELAINQPSTIK